MTLAVLPSGVAGGKFDYFDIAVICWLIIGLLLGRKRGMSQEFLPLLQWLGIVTAAGLLYQPFGVVIHRYTFFTMLWSDVAAYLLIATGVHLIYFFCKPMLAPKLAANNFFGKGEYYLGMTAGAIRFACMLLAVIALMNSRVETPAELAKDEQFQKDNFSDIRFPTYGQLQQDVLFKSYSGNFVRSKLKPVVMKPVVLTPVMEVKTNGPKSTNMIADASLRPAKK